MAYWIDETIYTPDEAKLRDITVNLFKQNYSLLELQMMVEKAVLRLALVEWGLKDTEAMEILGVTQKKYVKVRDLSGFTKKLESKTYLENAKLTEEAKDRMEKAKQQRAAQYVAAQARMQAILEAKKKQQEGDE